MQLKRGLIPDPVDFTSWKLNWKPKLLERSRRLSARFGGLLFGKEIELKNSD